MQPKSCLSRLASIFALKKTTVSWSEWRHGFSACFTLVLESHSTLFATSTMEPQLDTAVPQVLVTSRFHEVRNYIIYVTAWVRPYSTGTHPREGGCPKNCTWHSCRGTDPLRSFLVFWCGQSMLGHQGWPSIRLQTICPAEKRSWACWEDVPLALMFFKGFRGIVFLALDAEPFFLLGWSLFAFSPVDTGGEDFLKNLRSVPWDILRQRPAKTYHATIARTRIRALY